MHNLSEVLNRPNPLNALVETTEEADSPSLKIISDVIAKEGEIFIIPFDRTALAAARNIVTNWRRLLGCKLKMVDKNFVPSAISNHSLSILLSTRKPNEKLVFKILQNTTSPHLWFGPKLTEALEQIFMQSAGYHILKNEFSYSRADTLYAGVSLLLADSWKSTESSKAETVQSHLKYSSRVIDSLLNNISIKNNLTQTMAANGGYKTAFFLGPPMGAGLFWTEVFKQTGCPILEFYHFGESVHGPIVTVDTKIQNKFVRLENRKQMIIEYAEENLLQWERRFLGGTMIDKFLSQPVLADQSTGIDRPFFAEGSWYFPILRDDYDSTEDNLIIIDATSERSFAKAIDELAIFGCRYARMIVISQEAFRKDPEVLYQYPISHLIEMPSLRGGNGETVPTSDFLLPFEMNLLGVAMACAAAKK